MPATTPITTDNRLARAASLCDNNDDDPSSKTNSGLFAYGTLTMDAVMLTLLDRVPPSERTTAPGWRAAGLPDLPYPGLVADPQSNALGRLYLDLTEREWALLDAFENPVYDIAAVTLANGQRGLAYVWPVTDPPALAHTWTVDLIDPAGVEAYLARCKLWRQEWEAENINS
ncbi:hypothetical protein B0H63DRAFT_483318 [Podospora didyma]|uniref:Putative gamma-glutamylcyclotransferase n=1 Tax=Podospora didyma TaxID=330526 RepID=A0AAE0K8B5_9PEZI|nr:hypothetical protein B0H63DRAFT_483318 [Podospora didyma]